MLPEDVDVDLPEDEEEDEDEDELEDEELDLLLDPLVVPEDEDDLVLLPEDTVPPELEEGELLAAAAPCFVVKVPLETLVFGFTLVPGTSLFWKVPDEYVFGWYGCLVRGSYAGWLSCQLPDEYEPPRLNSRWYKSRSSQPKPPPC